VLLDRRLLVAGLQRLDIDQPADLISLIAGQEAPGSMQVSSSGASITDLGGEVIQKAPHGMLAGVGNSVPGTTKWAEPAAMVRFFARETARFRLRWITQGYISFRPDPNGNEW
jgi:hypothetical protein